MAGANSVLVPLYIKEYVPFQLFSKMSVLISLAVVSGQFTALAIGTPASYISGNWYWRVCLVPCIVAPILRMTLITLIRPLDTPTYYILCGRKDLTLKALSSTYLPEFVPPRYEQEHRNIFGSPQHQLEDSSSDSEKGGESFLRLLTTNPHYKIVLLGMWLFVGQ